MTPFSASSLVEIARARARLQETEVAYRFLVDGDEDEISLTYGELDRRARAIAAWLQDRVSEGERALLLYPPGLDFIVGFLGCLYAGVIGVPAYPPRLHRPDPRIQEILADAGAVVALTTEPILSGIERARANNKDLSTLLWCATDSVDSAHPGDWRETPVGSSTVAYLQYTSGSTRAPKGVIVTHANLLANLEEHWAWVGPPGERRFRHSEETVFVSWLPHFHDMGLVYGILQPLVMGLPAVLMPPAAFVQRPVRWLQALSRYRGTHSAGPNFAYEWCVEKVTPEQKRDLDLHHWAAAVNGAEPVRSKSIERFCDAFEPCGFDQRAFTPAYGLAEATLKVTAEPRGNGPYLRSVRVADLERGVLTPASAGEDGTRTLVGCGRAEMSTEVVIVDPETSSPCPPSRIGEIWVASTSVARGYWNRPEESELTFGARLPGRKTRFLRTGDLGCLWPSDGELFVTGRVKDLIIIRGRNHYPEDIELTVETSHPALLSGAGVAFSIEIEDEECLVLAQEIHRHRAGESAEVFESIRRSVVDAHELAPQAIVLVRQGGIPKTSSGKIQRRPCAKAFVEGSLPVVAEWKEKGLRRSTSSREGFQSESDLGEALSGDSFYQIDWERKDLEIEPSVSGGETAGYWIIFADASGFVKELEAALAKRGASSVLVSPGYRYERLSENHFRVRPDFLEDFEGLVSDLEGLSPSRLVGAVHLWSLDAAPPEETTLDSLAQAQSLGCSSLVHWIQSVVDRHEQHSPRLWIVTRMIQPVGGRLSGAPAAAHASVWGLGRTIAQEHPALWGGLIALDDLDPREGASLVSRELTASDGEDQVVLGNEGRHVARLARFQGAVGSDDAPPVPVREDASYLITGGLGDLGLLVARFLVDQGARSLILLGRSKLLPRSEWDRIDEASRMHQQIAAIRSLESLGARIHVASVDVSDEEQVKSFLNRWNEEGEGPIRGVVHAAGWVGLRTLQELDLEMLSATMRPKVAGGWILHRCLESEPLDFFVLFSSVASVLGFLGHGHYAAANAFLDGLAHYRHSRGLPALSINWGPWSDIGMAARTDQAKRLEPYGIRSLPPERGLALFRQLLANANESDYAQVIAVDVDWPRLSRSFQTVARSPLLSRLVSRSPAENEPPLPAGERRLRRERIFDAEPATRRELLETELRQRVSGVLGISPSKLDVDRPLMDMGMDSLMGVELKNQLEIELQVTLSMMDLMQGASVTRLASVLAEELERNAAPDAEAAAPVPQGRPRPANEDT